MKTRTFDVVPSPEDLRDYKIKPLKGKDLPEFVDLRPRLGRVKDQGNVGACAAYAASIIKEYHEYVNIGFKGQMSPEFIYSSRENQKTEGMTGRDVMRILTEIGSVPRTYWKPRYHNTQKIPEFLYQVAEEFQISGYARCDTLESVRTAINTNGVLWFAVPTYSMSRMDSGREIIVIPNDLWNGGVGRNLVGYHAMAIVGYDDLKERLIIRNSWGVAWGLHGNTYMPYSEFNKIIECWTFIDAETANIFKKRGRLKKKVRKLFGKTK